MRKIMFAWTSLLASAAALSLGAGPAPAAPAFSLALAAQSSSVEQGPLAAGYYRRDYDDDDYDDYVPPSYYAPRVYGYVQRYGDGPPIERYAPPASYPPPYFDDWGPPPRPASCGKYRYWNGEFCADARFNPPYVGPRW
jgi:hypothetical protein